VKLDNKNTTMAFMSNVTSHMYYFMDTNRPNLQVFFKLK